MQIQFSLQHLLLEYSRPPLCRLDEEASTIRFNVTGAYSLRPACRRRRIVSILRFHPNRVPMPSVRPRLAPFRWPRLYSGIMPPGGGRVRLQSFEPFRCEWPKGPLPSHKLTPDEAAPQDWHPSRLACEFRKHLIRTQRAP